MSERTFEKICELIGVGGVELDERGFAANRLLPDGREAAVVPLWGGRGRICVGPAFSPIYDDGY